LLSSSAAALACAFGSAEAQNFTLPYQTLQSLRVEMHSLRDEVSLYLGTPQQLLEVRTHPENVYPYIIIGVGMNPTLRIRDLALLENPPAPDSLDAGDFLPAEPRVAPPRAEKWELMLSPPAPTEFLLRCEGGSGAFDFTDMPVTDLQLIGVDAELRVEFRRVNRVPLERCRLVADGGGLELRQILNARAKVVTVQAPRATCRLELTGKPFDGTMEMYFEGASAEVELTVSREIGLHVEGPAALVARFAADHMQRQETGLVSRDYDKSRCKLRLHFTEGAKSLEVIWD
jgi:hypothetical protein